MIFLIIWLALGVASVCIDWYCNPSSYGCLFVEDALVIVVNVAFGPIAFFHVIGALKNKKGNIK